MRTAPRGFADDAARDAVILSVQDINVAQEAIALARAEGPGGGEPSGPGPGQPAPDPSPSPASSTPSWGTVLATTIRLWWQRRIS